MSARMNQSSQMLNSSKLPLYTDFPLGQADFSCQKQRELRTPFKPKSGPPKYSGAGPFIFF